MCKTSTLLNTNFCVVCICQLIRTGWLNSVANARWQKININYTGSKSSCSPGCINCWETVPFFMRRGMALGVMIPHSCTTGHLHFYDHSATLMCLCALESRVVRMSSWHSLAPKISTCMQLVNFICGNEVMIVAGVVSVSWKKMDRSCISPWCKFPAVFLLPFPCVVFPLFYWLESHELWKNIALMEPLKAFLNRLLLASEEVRKPQEPFWSWDFEGMAPAFACLRRSEKLHTASPPLLPSKIHSVLPGCNVVS